MDRLNSLQLDFFDWVLETSIMASILVGLVLFVKVILRNKLSPRWHYMLWLIVIARLLLPWAPESSYSLYSMLPYLRETLGSQEKPAPVPLAEVALGNNDFANPAGTNALGEDKQELPISVPEPKEEEVSTTFSVYQLAFYVWVVGVACVGIPTMIVNRRVYNQIGRTPVLTDSNAYALLEQCQKAMSIKQTIPLVSAGKIASPAVLGWIRPKIILPDSVLRTLGDHQLRFILYHELAHVKRNDIAINWLMNGLLILHWFNPLLWYAYYKMREDQEVACDALALTFIGDEQKESYGHTIISLLERYSKTRPIPGLATLMGGKKQLKRRILMIKSFQKNSYRWSALGLASLLAVSSISLVNAKELSQPGQENATVQPAASSVRNQGGPSKVEKKVTVDELKLDKKTISQAQEELRRFLGDSKAELKEVIDADVSVDWFLYNKNGKGRVGINKSTGQITLIDANYTWNEVAPAVKEAAVKAIRSLDPTKTFVPQSITREKHFTGGRTTHQWTLSAEGMDVILDADTLKVRGTDIIYPVAQADKKAVTAGLNALKVMNGGKSVVVTTAYRNYSITDSGHFDIWRFSDDGGLYVVEVGAKTGKIGYIYMYGKRTENEAKLPAVQSQQKENKPRFSTKEQAIAAAKPMVKTVFGIDLTGYSVQFHSKNPNVVDFSKKGQPTIQAEVDRTGAFWYYLVFPANGVRN